MRRAARGSGGEGGFSLVEIMLTLAISAIVIAGMYQSFNFLHKWWVAASLQSDQRQNARAGLETLTRDIEMAGYQTTNYGDVNKTGLAITLASINEIEMDQQRPDSTKITLASSLQTYEPRLVYYHLATNVTTGRQNLYRQIRTQPGLATPDEIVAENVSAFTLGYYDEQNQQIVGLPPEAPAGSVAYTPGTAVPSGSPLRSIRRVQVSLTTITARALPFGPASKAFTLTADVMPQNLTSTNEVAADTTPPATPSVPEVYDTRSCTGKLRVKWSNNSEPDLAGYVVFYGTTAKVVVPVNALADKNAPEITLNPDNLLITKFADSGRAGSTANAPNTYSVQVVAYDSGGNYSARSAGVSGNPDPDITAFGGADDSTVNPVKPTPPNTDATGVRTSVTVAPGAADGELIVTWQAPADDTATKGYRLYRSTTAFADGHIDDTLQIAMESTLPAGVTTWTDKNLEGCRTYYYAVASVNCDETLVAGYLNNGSNATLSDYAVGSGTTLDTTSPPAPSLAGSLPDYQKIFLTLANPLDVVCPDFDRTEIYWSKAPAPGPHINGTTMVVDDGVHVPDSDGGSPGTFRKRGSQVVLFDSETEAAPDPPSLTQGATYNLLAVSYDRCGNLSLPDLLSLEIPILPGTCVDDPGGAPPVSSFANMRYSTCQPDAVEIGWDYPDTTTVPDLVGFRVERTRSGGAAVALTSGPTALRSWTDAGPLQAGAEYYYEIKATDCLYELDPVVNATNASPPYRIPVTGTTIRPGQLQRFPPSTASGHELDAENFVTTISDASAPYTYHNNVKFFLQNTSRSPMTIKKMALAWDNPNVVLDSVTIGGSPSGTTAQTISAGGVSSGVAFTVNAQVTDVAGGIASPSGAVPVRLRFTTPSGAVNRLADMRSQTLGLSLWVRNDSLQDVDCPAAARLTIEVPRGPMLGGFSQSAPGLFGIDSYEVVGPSGTARDTDTRVSFGMEVNVFGTAFDNSRDLFADGVNRGFAALKLVGISAAAADPAVVPLMPAVPSPVMSPAFERPLQSIGGNRYAIYKTSPTAGALMPQVSDQVNWYYGLAVDVTGNWDRAPNPDYGNYAYYQPPFDVCTVTPQAPVLTLTSTTATSALLAWAAPTQYDDGTAIPGLDSLTYDVYVKSAGGDPWPSTPAGAGLTGLSFTHSADLLTGTYYYMVRAENACATPRASGYSNVVMECEGPSTADCSLLSVPTTARYADPIALAMSGICAYRDNGAHDDSAVLFRVDNGVTTSDFPATETYDDGAFAKTITAVWSGAGGDSVLAPLGSLSVNLVVAGATPCTARTVTITGGDCYTTPRAPTSFSAVRGANNSGAANLTWIRPNFNTDGTPITDLAGYQIEIARCAVYNAGLGSCDIWSAWTDVPLNDPAAQAYTWTGLVIDERYKFRMRAEDTCTTPNYSAYTPESSVVRVR